MEAQVWLYLALAAGGAIAVILATRRESRPSYIGGSRKERVNEANAGLPQPAVHAQPVAGGRGPVAGEAP